MTTLLQSIHKWEEAFDRRAERFTLRHPYLALFVRFIGMPVFILMAVAACTALVTFPVALIAGWL